MRFLVLIFTIGSLLGCTGLFGKDGEGDSGTSVVDPQPADADADADSDSDSDADADSDADTDTDTGSTTGLDPADLVGNSYVIDLTAGTVMKPAAIGSLLMTYIEDDLLMEVEGSGRTTLDLLSGFGPHGARPAEQDLCSPTADMSGSDFRSNPDFTSASGELTTTMSGASMVIEDSTITGTFAGAGDTIENAEFTGLVETDSLDALVGGGKGSFCDTLSSFGDSCVDCADGTPYCMELDIADLAGAAGGKLDLVPVTSGC